MSNLPLRSEGDHFINEARDDAGMGPVLSFNKGDYFLDGNLVPAGTRYTVYCGEWVKQWIKFGLNSVEDRKVYHVSRGDVAVTRESLGDDDRSKWLPGLDGKPKDPWVLQYLLPFQNDAGQIVVFRTSSWGGRRAVGDLCMAYGHRVKREGAANPIIKLTVAHIQSKKYGRIARPDFSIIGWDTEGEPVVMPSIKDDMGGDQIPF